MQTGTNIAQTLRAAESGLIIVAVVLQEPVPPNVLCVVVRMGRPNPRPAHRDQWRHGQDHREPARSSHGHPRQH